MKLLALLVGVAAGFSFEFDAPNDACADATTCTDCLDATKRSNCGWCAQNTTIAGSTGGPQCADLHQAFVCKVQFQTDKCNSGWKCNPSKKICEATPGGVTDKAACDASCSKGPSPPKPPPPPTPPKPTGKFTCDFGNTTALDMLFYDVDAADPKCTPCMDPPTPGQDCHYQDTASCSKECSWKYQCQHDEITGNGQCKKAKNGDPTQAECMHNCGATQYQCDQGKGQCIQSTSLPGPMYPDKGNCDKQCGTIPVPPELIGVYRGLAIQNSYATGEWLANVSNDTMAIWYPAQGAAYSLYLSGPTNVIRGQAGNYTVLVNSTAGKVKGTNLKLMVQDYSSGPDIDNYITLALDEAAPTTLVASYDSAMTTSTATVLGLEACPATGDLVNCTEQLDLVIVVDGSASITSTSWTQALSFLDQLVDTFVLAPDKVKVGVLQFSDTAAQTIALSADKAAVKSAVASMAQMQRNTNTGAGLALAKTMIDTQGRQNTSKAVIIITDGQANEGQSPTAVAATLKAEQIEIFGVGVGTQIDVQQLQAICSLPLSDHYFTVAGGFKDLSKILAKIAQATCHHTHTGGNVTNPKGCEWHLPTNLPLTATAPVLPMVDAPVPTEKVVFGANGHGVFNPPAFEPEAAVADPCNPYATCDSCIGQRSKGFLCGWCNGTLSYGGQTTGAKCSGTSATQGNTTWTCKGIYQTTDCGPIPGDCGLEGTYRGLRIDVGYSAGEWSANFSKAAQTLSGVDQRASFKFLDPVGNPVAYDGQLHCSAKCGQASDKTPFTLKLSNGTTLAGMCGYTKLAQAETTSLMWALSELPLTTSPTSWEESMFNTNATVYSYWKCAGYKAGICKFKLP
jgi:uncharacterized protein YegL